MGIEQITTVISSIGFPIAMCGALCWYINKRDKDNAEIISRMGEIIRKNTEAIHELLEKFTERDKE